MSAPVTDAIPEDIMFAAEEALDNMCCNCVESCGGAAGFRKASIEEIARPIFAERQRSGSMTETYRATINQQAEEIELLRAERVGKRKTIIEAMCQVSHSIDNDRVEFRFSPKRSGANALNQLVSALEACFGSEAEVTDLRAKLADTERRLIGMTKIATGAA